MESSSIHIAKDYVDVAASAEFIKDIVYWFRFPGVTTRTTDCHRLSVLGTLLCELVKFVIRLLTALNASQPYDVFSQCPRKSEKHFLRGYGGYRHTYVRVHQYLTYWRHVNIEDRDIGNIRDTGDIGDRYSRRQTGPDTCERGVRSYIFKISYISHISYICIS